MSTLISYLKQRTVLLLAAGAAILPLHAQQTVDTHTRIFDSSFKSLRTSLVDSYYAPPVIRMGSGEQLAVEFDQLSAERRYLRYCLVHCDAMWQPSQIVESEYIDGFNEAEVESVSFSSATFANYVHYSIALPNDDMQLRLSGNYLLKVYEEGNPDNVLLQQRFSVVENAVGLKVDVSSRTDVDYNNSHQQLTLAVDTRDYPIDNLYDGLKVAVLQNSRDDNSVLLTRPSRVAGTVVSFEHEPKLIFPAGNEFRRFEMVTTDYNGMGVERYSYHAPYYHVELQRDEPRSDRAYSYDRTQFGRFTIRMSSANDNNTEADYMITHFALHSPRLTGGAVYVDGEFTLHRFGNENRMSYNEETGCYELSTMLKQGAYNYQYLWVPDGSSVGQTARIEGDFYQTVNQYEILVYNRRRGERYDRLIGYGIVYSGK